MCLLAIFSNFLPFILPFWPFFCCFLVELALGGVPLSQKSFPGPNIDTNIDLGSVRSGPKGLT